MRFGLLSTAVINEKVLRGAAGSEEVEVVAIGSRDAGRAETYAREHGLARAHGSYEALLADPDVDAVYISLPNGMHHEWTLRSLAAGKHVLCEKPYTRRPAEVVEAFDAAERAGRVLMEAFMYRHNPQTRKLVELVRDGAIGELRLVRATFSHPYAGPGNIRLEAGLDGGSLMDVGCYCVSISRLLAGEPERVTGEQVAAGGIDVRFTGMLRFPGDVLAHFDCGLDLPDQFGLEVLGSTGLLRVPDPFHCFAPGIELLPNDGEPSTVRAEQADSYRLELENLAAAAAGTAEPLLGRADALGQALTIDALYRSAAEGRAVAL